MKKVIRIVIISFAILGCGSGGEEAGWTAWRGPEHNGSVIINDYNPLFPENQEALQWRALIGEGHSSMAVTEKFLYTSGKAVRNNMELDIFYCIDKKTGKKVWEFIHKPTQFFTYRGPKATPIVDNKQLYILAADGNAYCLDSRKGTEIWHKKLNFEGALAPFYGISGTPVIYGDMIIYNVSYAGIALDKNTGEAVWKTDSAVSGYASPLLFEYQGKTLLALFTFSFFHIVDPENGTVLSSVVWNNSRPVNAAGNNSGPVNAADPVYLGDGKFFVSSSGKGSALLDFSSGELVTINECKELEAQFSSMVLKDGYLYGISGNNNEPFNCRMVCFDPYTGEEKWSQNTRNYGSVLLINDTVVLLLENGLLTTIKADPTCYEEIAKVRFFEGRRVAWIAPVACGGVLYLKSNLGEIAAIRID